MIDDSSAKEMLWKPFSVSLAGRIGGSLPSLAIKNQLLLNALSVESNILKINRKQWTFKKNGRWVHGYRRNWHRYYLDEIDNIDVIDVIDELVIKSG